MTLPHIDDDGDEEMEIDEEAVEKLCIQVEKQSAASGASDITDLSYAESVKSDLQLVDCELRSSNCKEEQDSEDTDVKMEEVISEQEETMIADSGESVGEKPEICNSDMLNCHNVDEKNDQETETLSFGMSAQDNNTLSSSSSEMLNEESESKTVQDNSCSGPNSERVCEESACVPVEERCNESPNRSMNCVSPCLRIVPCDASPVLKSPTPSVSPKTNSSRKSLRTSSMLSASQKQPLDNSMSLTKSPKGSSSNTLSTQTSKSFLAPTEHLAASIRNGLEIIDSHRQSSAFRRSMFRFSYKPTESKSILPVPKVDVAVQTIHDIQSQDSLEFTCSSCKNRMQPEVKEANEGSNLQLVPVDGLESAEKLKLVPKVSLLAEADVLVLTLIFLKEFSEISFLVFFFYYVGSEKGLGRSYQERDGSGRFMFQANF